MSSTKQTISEICICSLCLCCNDLIGSLSIEQRIDRLTSGYIRLYCFKHHQLQSIIIPSALVILISKFITNINNNQDTNNKECFDFDKLLKPNEIKQRDIQRQIENDAYNFGNRYWIYGLFDCCYDIKGIKSFLYTCFCPCCVAGEISVRADVPPSPDGGSYINGCICCCTPCCYPCFFSNPLREKRGITAPISWIYPECCGDCLLWYCCPCCQMTRELREVRTIDVNEELLIGGLFEYYV